MMRRKFVLLGLTCAALAAASFSPALAQEDFYRGKEIKWILSAGAGGGYSSYANAFAPFLSARLPGKPNIVVQNMPGAGGLRAMQYLFTSAPKDGTTIGLVHSSVPFAPLFDMAGANFDPRKFGWIGSLNRANEICASWHTSGVRTWQDMMEKEFIVGGTGGGSQMETMPAMINKLFGTRIKIISGYTGGNDVYLAMERGEVHGRCGGLVSSINSTRPDWFPKHKISVPIIVSLDRSNLFPDAPALVEFAKDERTRRILKLVLFPLEMDRPVLAPPGVPAERIAALRTAFHAAMTDPGFIADAEKANIEIGEIPGAKLQTILDEAFGMPPDIVKAANEAMNLTGSSGD